MQRTPTLSFCLSWCAVLVTLISFPAHDSSANSPPAIPGYLTDAVADPQRSAKDRARDADRHPANVLAFAGIEPGMRVVDLGAGGGYYTEILAHAVGPKGKVTIHNVPSMIERFGDMGVPALLKKPGMSHVKASNTPLDALELKAGSYDAAVFGLFYHDTMWLPVDRAKMNAQILAALKPGGVFLVFDHQAEVGSGERDVETLHRGDAEQIRREVVAAGFEFVAESTLLSNPGDDRKRNVFEEGLRGKTDRFLFKFRKPAH